jgi:hypothetical protein
MNALESLRKRAGMLIAGLASFLALIAAMRWSNGEPLVQPSADIGILIGAAMVALYFVMSDARASKSGPERDRAPELH